MIYSELYSVYYNTMAKILKQAVHQPVPKREFRKLVERYAFEESLFYMEPAVYEERWQLLKADGSTPIRHDPTMPLTTLQKKWLNAVYCDPRIRLFTDGEMPYPREGPLFTKEDYCIFDSYSDGDPYEKEDYVRHFRMVLDAVRNQEPIQVRIWSAKRKLLHISMLPEYLEYSEKDDKFRVIGRGKKFSETVNIASILECRKISEEFIPAAGDPNEKRPERIVLSVSEQRNTPERVLLHFAHFKKQAEKAGDGTYRVTIEYAKEDETEMVIRVLSFGPFVRVIEPEAMIEKIRKRLAMQMGLGCTDTNSIIQEERI